MNGQLLQLLILAGVAVFLVLRLRSVIGTRQGYEAKPDEMRGGPKTTQRDTRSFEAIEGWPDQDIGAHTDPESNTGKALTAMKRIEPEFNVSDFIGGAKGAYEMILMAYENGDLDTLEQFLAPDVYAGFRAALEARDEKGLSVQATFVGVSGTTLKAAKFDTIDNVADITLRFVGEMTSVVKDADGTIVEGSSGEVKRQSDMWTFSRVMGADNPNWLLVATGQ